MDNPCKLLVTHEGKYVLGPPTTYEGGTIEEVEVDSDCMAIFELYQITKLFKYNPPQCTFYYLMPNCGFENGFRAVTTDQ